MSIVLIPKVLLKHAGEMGTIGQGRVSSHQEHATDTRKTANATLDAITLINETEPVTGTYQVDNDNGGIRNKNKVHHNERDPAAIQRESLIFRLSELQRTIRSSTTMRIREDQPQ